MSLTKKGRVSLSLGVGLVMALVISFSLFYAQILTTINLNVERKGHTATLLQDGSIFIAGGDNAWGPLASTEIYDPGTQTFAPKAMLAVPRAGHTATLLNNGTVLIAGGLNGGPLASTEIYDTAANAFAPGPEMNRARAGHTATVLNDGRILIAGGAADATAEIYDPATGLFTLWGTPMNEARFLHSAVLRGGEVLIVGGVNLAGQPLDSVELFTAGQFYALPTHMISPRVRPLLRLLPDGKLQIVGGNEAAAAGTIEMFDRDQLEFKAQAHILNSSNWLEEVTSAQTRAAIINRTFPNALLGRGDYTLTELPALNQALLVGGSDAAGTVLASGVLFQSSPSTTMTAILDYPVFSTVSIAGTGWMPMEQIMLKIHQEEGFNSDRTIVAAADGSGNFVNQDLILNENDLGTTMIITAHGQSSAFVAQTAFADAGPHKINFTTEGLPSGISISVNYDGKNNGGQDFHGPISFSSPGPSSDVNTDPGSFFYYSFPSSVTNSGQTYNLQSSAPASGFKTGASNGRTAVKGTYAAACTAPSITAQPSGANPTVGESATFSVGATGDAPLKYQWRKNNVEIGGATGSSYTIASVVVADAGSYDVVVSNSCGSATSTAVTLTVNKADPTIDVMPYNVTYDGSSHTATGTAKGVNGETLSGLDLSGTTHTNAGDYPSDNWTFTDSTGNYNNSSGAVHDSIAKADATIKVTPYDVTYDGEPHTASGTATGVKDESLSGLDLNGSTHTNAGDYPTDAWTFTDNTGNYKNAAGTVGDHIARADAKITVTPYNVTYNGEPHAASGTAEGVKDESLSGLDLNGTTHTNAGDYPTDPWTFTDGTGNYNNTSGTVHDSIAKANASIAVTPYSVTYDGNAHTASGTATGIKGEGLSGLDLSGTTHTNAGDYTGDAWSFTNANYNDASGTVHDQIAKANANIVVTGYIVTYDGNSHTAAGTAKGVKGETLSGLDLSGTVHTNAGDYPSDPWTFTDATGNYNNAGGTVHDSIAKANANITVTPYSVTYDGNSHTATGSATGVNGEGLRGFDLSATTHTNAGNYADPYTFTDVTGNYNNANGTISDSIARATATIFVTPYNVIYDHNVHTATGTATGVKGESLAGLNLSGTTHANPGDYLVDPWVFTDVTGNYNNANGTVRDRILYATVTCPGSHQILQPINTDGSSVFKQKSTVPAKFRVCDASCISIGTPGVVASFKLIQFTNGTVSDVDEAVDSTTPDTAFRWSPTDQLWIFNINTKSLTPGRTYVYLITLDDGSTITFQFGLK